MNGAESLIRGLISAGVNVCFANPGTSEMHMVQAIDGVNDMRAILCLFEGVCTGAADGYARMKETPACTLLHLGAGLGNGIANLHNARRASTPLVNLIGDHAAYHVHYDAPLTSDIADIAKGVSSWIRNSATAQGLGQDARDAVAAALSANPDNLGNVATLIIPADCSWGAGHSTAGGRLTKQTAEVTNDGVIEAVDALGNSGADTLLLLDGLGLSAEGVQQAGRIVKKTGCRVFSTTFPARVESGPGLFPVPRMPYFPEHVMDVVGSVKKIVMAGARAPVSFFAYPNSPSELYNSDCDLVRLAHRHQNVEAALKRVADALDAPEFPDTVSLGQRPVLPEGELTTSKIGQALAAMIPDQSIVAVDSGGGGAAYATLQQSVRHTWLNLTGGSIGQGGPVSVGAAVACPERPVFALLGDGGAGYTIQYLWTAARENLNIVTVIFSNSSYNILDVEYHRLGVNSVGEKAASLFDLSNPEIDWVSLATGYGVPAARAVTADEFVLALQEGMKVDGPFLIEAKVNARD
ncbi:MAG: acetolactate synthase large subunit [Gammaproteobacteria bacterium]|nr:acetolactate synthase large subunit [Gammaproteobacteria bacterium]